MTQPPSGSSAHGDRGDGRAANGGPSDGWPDDGWPDEQWPDDAQPADYPAGWPAAPRPDDGAGPLTWLRSNLLTVALIAVLAGVAGAFTAFLLTQGPSAAPGVTRTPAGALPSFPGQPAGGGSAAGGLPGGGGQLQMLLAGKVTAVSSTSITVEGQGNSVTGAVTSATTVTGKVTSIGGVKVGDQVLVKFTGTPGSGAFTAATIQDPASIS